ncbi:excinuclease ABC subunit UvrA [Myxococcota bacterium]|nr:excinuclease ABC subunit UvrA [Myxococcota bacterium]
MSSNPTRRSPEIRIEGARSHNLKSVDCRIPLGSLTVFSGVSGSGKSTLAFDTLYAEGQRRYITSLSTYARQFLERLPRPEVDSISHLPPTIAIERRNRVTNARSTVGTATEVLDFLRLLYAHVGETHCAGCDRRVEPGTVESIADRILQRWEGRRVSIGAPIVRVKGERPKALRERLLREGYARLLDEKGAVVEVEGLTVRRLQALQRTAWLLIDRMALKREDGRRRIAESVASAFERSGGICGVHVEDGDRAEFQRGFVCDGCGNAFMPPEPALFSFNSPLGACAECQGFGRIPVLDRDRVVPDPTLSLQGGAIAPFASPSGRRMQSRLMRACEERGVPVDAPYESLSDEDCEWIFEGEGRGGWRGVAAFFSYLERKRYRVQARVMIARYRKYDPCPACEGARLRSEAMAVRVGGMALPEVCLMTPTKILDWLKGLELEESARERIDRLVSDVSRRLETMIDVGLDYLTLERSTRTLSGGEAQRIQLASALGGTLTASLYILDEPSVGLHPRDVERLIGLLRRIRDQGNTLVVVEHAPEVVAFADHIVDLGPRAGSLGGKLLVEGGVEEVEAHFESLTGRALRGDLGTSRRRRRSAHGKLRVVGATDNNLRELSVDFPLGQLVAVTGVSGAGKSSLVGSVLVGQLLREPDRGACERIEGRDLLSSVVRVDSSPPPRSSRSNPATVSKAFDLIRRRFAETPEAKRRGVTPGWFSFNVAGGRCESCEGTGISVVDMQFLDDVRMPCEFCEGVRYRPEALEIELHGLHVAGVLELTIDDAIERFRDDRRVVDRLALLARVGLGYLTLGQPLSILSSGELQRLRLARALGEGGKGVLFVLDEPTTGLHPADVEVLVGCLDQVLDAGGSVILVEHNVDVIAQADHVIDLGPEGGSGGGRVVAEGPPEQILKVEDSHTARALRNRLNSRQNA